MGSHRLKLDDLGAALLRPPPKLPLALIAIVSQAVFLGLAILAWGNLRGFLAHPARIGACIAILLLTVLSLFTRISLSSGRREDRTNRWIFLPISLLSLAMAFVPPFTDRRNLGTIDSDAVRYLGLLLLIVGRLIRIVPMFVLGHRFSGLVAIQEGHTLVTTGLYRAIRHPSYFGALLAMAGWVLIIRSAIGLLLWLPMIWILVARMDSEEALLLEEFGDEYAAYRERTWRLIPFVY